MGLPDTPIRIFPDPCLRRVANRVSDPTDPKINHIIELLERVMRAQRHGIGIAAPQIGVSLQIALIDVSRRNPKEGEVRSKAPMVLINPVILALEGEMLSREGCMSLPDYRGDICRHNRVLASWMDTQGKRHVKEATGIEAVCIQHEVDHLHGMLFIDRISSLKRDLIPRAT